MSPADMPVPRGGVRVRLAGSHAVLLECADATEVAAWHAELVRRRDSGALVATELVPAARTVLVDGVCDPATFAESLVGQRPQHGTESVEGALVEIRCEYDGPDLADVAELWGTSTEGVVARHTGIEFRVAFCGFSPGFGYLTGLPDELAVPRRPSPRPRVPTGSVALAGEYTGVYPSPSPGGWQLIGRTDFALFDPDAESPAVFVPGTRVRFVAVSG